MILPSKAHTNLYINFSRLIPQLSVSTVWLRLFSLSGNLSTRQRESPGKEQREKESRFPEDLAVSPGLRRMTKVQTTDPEEIRDRRHPIAWETWGGSGIGAIWRPQHLSSVPGCLMGIIVPASERLLFDWGLLNGRAHAFFHRDHTPLPSPS